MLSQDHASKSGSCEKSQKLLILQPITKSAMPGAKFEDRSYDVILVMFSDWGTFLGHTKWNRLEKYQLQCLDRGFNSPLEIFS